MTSLLEGVRVLELSHVMAAPTCGLMLSDMGADVIKVERLPDGDSIRKLAPFVNGMSGPFSMMNRNNRGIALNLRSREGKAILRNLIQGSDVFIENYRKGAMEHYGIGYNMVKNENSKLIYCSLSGYGRTGPFAEKGGFDLVAQGMSGLMSITGEGVDKPPVKVGAPVTDITAGILAAMGILAALVNVGRTGKGQYVDTSLFEAGIMHTYWQSAIYFGSGEVPRAMGSAHPLIAPYQAFQTSDGWINVGSATQDLWLKLVDLLKVPELGTEPRFRDPNTRLENIDELVKVLTECFMKDNTENWVEKLDKAGIPAGPVLDIAEMSRHPQVLARKMVQELEGSVNIIGHPVKYSETPAAINFGAPKLGQHTRAILSEASYTEKQISEFISAGAALCSDP